MAIADRQASVDATLVIQHFEVAGIAGLVVAQQALGLMGPTYAWALRFPFLPPSVVGFFYGHCPGLIWNP